jgi:hypothetical protein
VSTLAIVALLAVVLLGSSYIVGPFVVWRVTAQNARAHFPPHDWREAVFGCGPGMLALHERLVALGYAPAAASALSMSHSATRFVVYRHADDSLAMAMHFATAEGTFDSVEFSIRLAGDIILTLGNALTPGIYPRYERQRAYVLSGWTDLEDMLARFRRLRARQDVVEDPVPAGQELEAIGAWITEQNQWLLAKGFFRRRTDPSQLYLSLPAAFRAAYRVQWPLKGYLLSARRRDALLATAP